MKKITLVVALLGCIQLQSSYAMRPNPTLQDLLNRSMSGSSHAKAWVAALARGSVTGVDTRVWMEALRAGAQGPAAEAAKQATEEAIRKAVAKKTMEGIVKGTVEEVGKEATKKAASGFWGCVGGLAGNIGVDIAWRVGTTAFRGWQNKKLNEAEDKFYSALEKNKDNELNILTGFPKGCEKEIAALLKLPGGQEFLEYYLNRLCDAYNKEVEKR